jgi:hypothetical protein
MQRSGGTPEKIRLLREFVEVEVADQVELLGDSLPLGLRLSR